MTGADLKCECGAGAADVAPSFKLFPKDDGYGLPVAQRMAYAWKCHNGHQNITGFREFAPGRWGFEQKQFQTVH